MLAGILAPGFSLYPTVRGTPSSQLLGEVPDLFPRTQELGIKAAHLPWSPLLGRGLGPLLKSRSSGPSWVPPPVSSPAPGQSWELSTLHPKYRAHSSSLVHCHYLVPIICCLEFCNPLPDGLPRSRPDPLLSSSSEALLNTNPIMSLPGLKGFNEVFSASQSQILHKANKTLTSKTPSFQPFPLPSFSVLSHNREDPSGRG